MNIDIENYDEINTTMMVMIGDSCFPDLLNMKYAFAQSDVRMTSELFKP